MKDFVAQITRQTHETSVKKLKPVISEKVLEYLDLNLLREIAGSLTAVTQISFLYTGIITEGTECLNVEFKSSDKRETVSMVIHYDVTLNEEGFDFIGLNEQMEKLVETPVEKPAPPKKKKVRKKKPVKKVDPKLLDKALDTIVEKEKIVNKKKLTSAMNNALDTIVEKEKKTQKTKSVLKLLETLTEKETVVEKKSDPIDLLRKALTNEKK